MELLEYNEIKISSCFENLVKVEKMIEDVCEEHKVNSDYFGNILIAVTEAVNNAIQHGNKLNKDKNIFIRYQPGKGKLCFFITDEGTGFDYDSLPNPTLPENIEKTSGRGIFLMKHLADEILFHENGKRVELHFNITPTQE
jgi:serine/threonine-protein kinase RsbW